MYVFSLLRCHPTTYWTHIYYTDIYLCYFPGVNQHISILSHCFRILFIFIWCYIYKFFSFSTLDVICIVLHHKNRLVTYFSVALYIYILEEPAQSIKVFRCPTQPLQCMSISICTVSITWPNGFCGCYGKSLIMWCERARCNISSKNKTRFFTVYL